MFPLNELICVVSRKVFQVEMIVCHEVKKMYVERNNYLECLKIIRTLGGIRMRYLDSIINYKIRSINDRDVLFFENESRDPSQSL